MASKPKEADPFDVALAEIATATDRPKYFASLNVDCARTGNVEAARDVLADFADAVDRLAEGGWPPGAPYYQTARYLADCFRRILDEGEEPAHALNLVGRKRGRRTGATEYDEEVLAAVFWFFVRRGVTGDLAKKEIGSEFGCSERTVQRAANKYSSYETIELGVLKVAFRPNADRVTKILGRTGQKNKN